eukprot:gene1080-59198_t
MADDPPAPAPPLPPNGACVEMCVERLTQRLERALGPGAQLPPSATWGELLQRQEAGTQLDAPGGRPQVAERYAFGGQPGAVVVASTTRGLVTLGCAAERAGATVSVAEDTGFTETAGPNRQMATVFAFGLPGKDHGVKVDPKRMAMHWMEQKNPLPAPLDALDAEIRAAFAAAGMPVGEAGLGVFIFRPATNNWKSMQLDRRGRTRPAATEPLLLMPVGGAAWSQFTDDTAGKVRSDFYLDVARSILLAGTANESAVTLKTGPDGALAFVQPAVGLARNRALGVTGATPHPIPIRVSLDRQWDGATANLVSDRQWDGAIATLVSDRQWDGAIATLVSDRQWDGAIDTLVSDRQWDGAIATLVSDRQWDGAIATLVSDRQWDGAIATLVSDRQWDGAIATLVSDRQGDGATATLVSDRQWDGAIATLVSDRQWDGATATLVSDRQWDGAIATLVSDRQWDGAIATLVSDPQAVRDSAAAAEAHHAALAPCFDRIDAGDDGFDTRMRLSTPRARPADPPPPPAGGGPSAEVLAALVKASQDQVEAIAATSSRGEEAEDGAGELTETQKALERVLGSHPLYHLEKWGQAKVLAWPKYLDVFIQNPDRIRNRRLRRKFKVLAEGTGKVARTALLERPDDIRQMEEERSRGVISEMINCALADTVLLDRGVGEDDHVQAEKELRRRRGLPERWGHQDDESIARDGLRQLGQSFEFGAERLKAAARTSQLSLTAPAGEGGYVDALDNFDIPAPGAARAEDEERERRERERRTAGGASRWDSSRRGGGGAQPQQRRDGAPPQSGAGAKAFQAYTKKWGDAPDPKKPRPPGTADPARVGRRKCFHCGVAGHLKQDCLYLDLGKEAAHKAAREPPLPGAEAFHVPPKSE